MTRGLCEGVRRHNSFKVPPSWFAGVSAYGRIKSQKDQTISWGLRCRVKFLGGHEVSTSHGCVSKQTADSCCTDSANLPFEVA